VTLDLEKWHLILNKDDDARTIKAWILKEVNSEKRNSE
jgi:hypothetical protein